MLLIWYRLGLIVYLIWILGYECHNMLDTNVKRMDTNVINLVYVGFDCLSDLDTWIRMSR